ncbi:MAG: IS21-like element helper ATPase IstB [Candidatus Wallbacteria bacterium]|nr:IS21-like element helper ATPase IstB [Candidatus Wallbacteria bacterium]
MNNYKQVLTLLSGLQLNGMAENVEHEINEAEAGKISYLNFFKSLLESELTYRRKRKLERNLSGAHFEVIKKLEDFTFKMVTGITKTDVANLIDLRWLDNHENLLFFGPPGVGKTHLAVSFGMKAIDVGYTVCFERMTGLVKLLKNREIQRSANFRINRIMKASLLIIDEVGYTPIERKEANLFFNLVSELYEKSSIIITSNKGFDSWAEIMGDQIMTVALLDRLLHHAKVFNLDGGSFRLNGKEN